MTESYDETLAMLEKEMGESVESRNPAVIFSVNRITPEGDIHYTIKIPHANGVSESHGIANIGEELSVEKEELQGDEEAV